jgi:DNA polymerase-1
MTATPWDVTGVPITPITTDAQLSELADAVSKGVRFAVDTETHAETSFQDGLWSKLRVIAIGVKFADDSYHGYVIDVRDLDIAALAPIMASIPVADAWNANFDQRVLRLAGCDVASWRDAMFTDSLLHSGLAGFEFWHGLAFSAKKFLGVDMTGKGSTQTSYDGVTDLSQEQVMYAGRDAVITLRLAEQLDQMVEAAGLTIPVELEQGARPFILSMMDHGLPFDYQAWTDEVIAKHIEGRDAALATLANLSGGGDVTLFGESEMPSWNPDSETPTRDALNTWAKDAVMKFTGGRLLTKVDKLDKTTLKQIDHPIAKALLKYRDHAKVLTTYGDNLEKFIWDDGRIHPQYKQGGVVATGRLASDKPNAQNFAPAMKKYFRAPAQCVDGQIVPRVFVYADLSQAELRVLAQVSSEERMRDMFRLGGDFHARTAADMFKVDMDGIKDTDPEAYSNNRKKAKGVNFGIPYGLGAAALATNLTVNNKLPTTTAEAKAMLDQYAKAYPNVDRWLGDRDKYVKEIAANPGPVDWKLTLALHELWAAAETVRKSFKRSNKRNPSGLELAELVEPESTLRTRLTAELGYDPSAEEIATERTAQAERYDWAFTFDRPVVLRPDGSIWSFESRTLTGRRRVLSVPTDSSVSDKFEGLITSAVLTIATSDKEAVAALRAEFAALHNLPLPVGVNRGPASSGRPSAEARAAASEFRKRERVSIVKAFEGGNKPLKYALVKFARERMGDEAVLGYLLPMALSDQIRAKGNQYRNHPIQSLVADIGLEYYAELHRQLGQYRDAFPVQAVHDSIAIECDLAEAAEICRMVKATLEAAMSHWCPDVPAKADADIRVSLSDDDVISEDEIAAKLEELTGRSHAHA